MSLISTPTYLEYLEMLPDLAESEPVYLREYLREHPALDHFFDTGPHILYLFDYSRRQYLYVTPNVQYYLGYPTEVILSEGVDFMLNIYQKDDLTVFNEHIFRANLGFIRTLPPEERPLYRISHTYRLRSKAGNWVNLLQQNSFVQSDARGNPVLSLGTVSDITPYKTDTKIVHRIDRLDRSGPSQNVLCNSYFPNPEEGLLTRREIEVLKWVLEGLNSQAIAEKMNIALHTVKTHRKNMLEKTAARNTAELIRYGITHGLI